MRRILEFGLYAVFILYFLLRYADAPDDGPRRPGPDAPQDPAVLLPEGARLPADIAPAVIVEIDMRAQNSVGTAFAVDDKGTYVSARHVIEGCQSVGLVRGGNLIPVQQVTKAENRDFAVLRVAGIGADPFELTTDAPRRGDDGFMMGYPQGNPADVYATVIGSTVMRSRGRYTTRERVVAWVERERRPAFDGSLGGISGGPVFDAAGRIVGTVVAGAPRRGRVYSTNPRVFEEAGLTGRSGSAARARLTRDNFDAQAGEYRRGMRIAQVYCQAS